MISGCVVSTVKHGGGCVMLWGCFAGDTDLYRIQGTINQHAYHSILQRYAIPSGLRLMGLSFVFPTGQWYNTPPGCVRAIWPRRRVMECYIRWPGLHNHLTSTQLRWFGMSWTAEWRKSAQHVGTPSRRLENHSRWSWLRKAKLSSNAKGGYFEESQLYFFSYYMIPCVISLFWCLHRCRT